MRSQETRNPTSATKTRNLRRLLHAYMEEAANTNLAGVGDRIRQARLEAGLTQDELSDLIGVGMRQIQYYEAGESNPYRTLRRIAEATGQTVGWLLHGDPAIGPGEDAAEVAASLDRRLEVLATAVAEMVPTVRAIAEALGVPLAEGAPPEAGSPPQPAAPKRRRRPA